MIGLLAVTTIKTPSVDWFAIAPEIALFSAALVIVLGRSWIRHDPRVHEASLFTAIAGGINAYWITFVDPASAFDLSLNIRMVIMAMLGGPGTIFGPVLGAFVLSAVYEVLANWLSTAAALLFGVVIVLSAMFMPRGIADLIKGTWRLGPAYLLQNIRQHRL